MNMRDASGTKAPIWVLAVLGVMTALPIMFTVLGYTNPAPLFAGWKAFGADGGLALTGPMGFYLSRNIATIGISLYALATRRRDTLFMALLLRVLTELMDGLHMLIGGAGLGGASVAFVILAVELAALLRVRTSDR